MNNFFIKGFRMQSFTLNIIIETFSKQENIKEVEHYYQMMINQNIKRNEWTYSNNSFS